MKLTKKKRLLVLHLILSYWQLACKTLLLQIDPFKNMRIKLFEMHHKFVIDKLLLHGHGILASVYAAKTLFLILHHS